MTRSSIYIEHFLLTSLLFRESIRVDLVEVRITYLIYYQSMTMNDRYTKNLYYMNIDLHNYF